jgi:GT2 family glycosyltransferase
MNDTENLISVIIISYDGIDYIGDCLSSVIKSLEGAASEVIVVDNGSKDGTVELIKETYSRVHIICNKSNLGFARAVNQGLEIAQGQFVLLLNQDTKIVNKAISKLAEGMKKDKKIGTIGPKFIGPDGSIQKSARSFPRYRDLFYEFSGLAYVLPKSKLFSNWKMGWFDHLSEKKVDQPMGAALMIRREVIEKVGHFDTRFPLFFNDVDYCRRVVWAGYENLYYPEAVVMHHVGGSTRKRKAAMIVQSHKAMYEYFKKYNKNLFSRPVLYLSGAALFVSACLRVLYSRITK